MILPVIKEMLSERLGHQVRYPSDCERLSFDIFNTTHQHIGVTTLKRLLGFVGGSARPRMSTLDIIALYLGYQSYPELLSSLDPDSASGRPDAIGTLISTALRPGATVELVAENSAVRLEYMGESRFVVRESALSGLEPEECIVCDSFRVGYPLYIRYAIKKNMRQGSRTLAAYNGIEGILTW